jgi:nucleotide-binding universal stress UspA family protein
MKSTLRSAAPAASVSVGEVLLSEAHALQCDLLVMGGYSHAPIREHLFGGVTYFVIEHATVPVLLSH